MNKFLTGLCASTLALSLAATSFLPANAAPMFVPQSVEKAAPVVDVENVQFRERGWDGERRWDRRDRREMRRIIRRNNDVRYHNGYRGYREYRPGYRRHGDAWYPAAAFIAGALITGAIVNSNRSARPVAGNHVEWCYDRYRSYRASDNTFQPNSGPRRQCNSPYG